MKSFQDWLDLQLYSSHIKNLTKIKQQKLNLRTNQSRTRNQSAKTSFYYMRRNTIGAETPPLTVKQKGQEKEKKDFLANMRINQQNIKFASRLINVSPVISKNKQIQSYEKYQTIIRRNHTLGNRKLDACRSKKLKRFMQIHNVNAIKGIHQAILRIRIMSLPRIPNNHEPTIWVEICSGMQKTSSNHYSLPQVLSTQLKFPLMRLPGRQIHVKIHCSRGLQYINLGQYVLEIPKIPMSIQMTDVPSREDIRKTMGLYMEIEGLENIKKVLKNPR